MKPVRLEDGALFPTVKIDGHITVSNDARYEFLGTNAHLDPGHAGPRVGDKVCVTWARPRVRLRSCA